jgi:hypothetical protein
VKFKLDENIGRRGIEFLRASGHDVSTVADQGLSGIGDRALFDVCAAEGRALITLDNDFGQVLRFPPPEERRNSDTGRSISNESAKHPRSTGRVSGSARNWFRFRRALDR